MSNITDFNVTKYIGEIIKSDSSLSGVLYGLLALLSGLATTFLSKWMDKRKTKKEETNEDFQVHLKASNDLIENAKTVSDMARDLLKDQEDIFQKKIEAAISGAKEECSAKIEELKSEYLSTIETLTKQVKILEFEKNELIIKMQNLEGDNKVLTQRVADFQTRLKKYEKVGTGPLSGDSK